VVLRRDRAFVWFLFLFFIVWASRATVLYAYDLSVPAGMLRTAYQAAVKFALWVVPACAYLWLTGERQLGRGLKLTTPFTRGVALWTAIGVSVVGADVLLSRLMRPNPAPTALLQWPALLLGGAPAVLFEEILFRGFVLPQLSMRWRFWPANLTTAFLFMLAHVPNWLWTRGPVPSVWLDLAGVFALACWFGYLVRRTDSLWPAVATHLANNFLVAVL
jgi:membrane protease YdiL (CAAX protease family)